MSRRHLLVLLAQLPAELPGWKPTVSVLALVLAGVALGTGAVRVARPGSLRA